MSIILLRLFRVEVSKILVQNFVPMSQPQLSKKFVLGSISGTTS